MHYQEILDQVEGKGITLIAVSKKRSIEEIRRVYEAGCRDFGENRVQELLEKIPLLPSDIRWHMIGTLQRKKVKEIIGKVHLIHSIDTLELAKKIADESTKRGVVTSGLLQVNTSHESSKHGLSIEGWREHLREVVSLQSLDIKGLMTMAPLTKDAVIIRETFRKLRLFGSELNLPLLSMGMSHDYLIAIEEGANILRIGTALFSN